MKLTCERCGKRFVTSGEPLPGHAYVVRCTCGNAIHVKGPPLAAPRATTAVPASSQPARSAAPLASPAAAPVSPERPPPARLDPPPVLGTFTGGERPTAAPEPLPDDISIELNLTEQRVLKAVRTPAAAPASRSAGRRPRGLLIAAAASAALGVLVLAWASFGRRAPVATEPMATTAASVPPPAAASAPALPQPAAHPASPTPTEGSPSHDGPGTVETVREVSTPPAIARAAPPDPPPPRPALKKYEKRRETARAAPQRTPVAVAAAAAVAPRPPEPPRKGVDPPAASSASIPALKPLEASDVQTAIARNQGAFDACVREAAASGNAALMTGRRVGLFLTLNPSGHASDPDLDDAVIDGTSLGTCLKRAGMRMALAPFQGEPVQVRIPLVLGRAD